jgi:hypothetical protein
MSDLESLLNHIRRQIARKGQLPLVAHTDEIWLSFRQRPFGVD